jgi:hypothetical protein
MVQLSNETTGDTDMNAINWMMSKADRSDVEANEDKGWPAYSEYFFKGNLPSRMVREIKKYASEQGCTQRDTNNEATYNWRDGENSYSATFGAHKSTQYRIRFSAMIVED